MKRIACLSLLVILAISCCGCSNRNVIEPAPIHEVRVSIAESAPPQVFVYIKGGLKDSCTVFHQVTLSRTDAHTVSITVTTSRPGAAQCAQVYGYFEQNVNLGTDFTAGETYTIRVNDQTTTFVMSR